jgi:CRP/FNR family transcriptional regulator, cyclic AMP receptor protein
VVISKKLEHSLVNEKHFQNTAQSRLQALAKLGELGHFRKGSILIEEGEPGSNLLIVLIGRLKAFSKGSSGTREVTYGVYGVGDFIGEMSLDGGPRSASVVCLEATTCSVVSKDTVKRFIVEEPEFAFDLLSRVIDRARRATKNARNLALTNAYGRLTEFLISEAKSLPDGVVAIENFPSHREISGRIGSSREMVSRLLKDLQTGDYVEIDARKRLVLRKPLPSSW